MASGVKTHLHAIEHDTFAVTDFLRRARKTVAIAQPHDVERFPGREHMLVPSPGVIRMGVRNQSPLHGPGRIDMEPGTSATDTGRGGYQQLFGAHAAQNRDRSKALRGINAIAAARVRAYF